MMLLTWFFVVKKKDFLRIIKEFPEYTIFLRERAILRRAHFMKIEAELYNDYTNILQKKSDEINNMFYLDNQESVPESEQLQS